jgi:hypothetical protein
LGIFVRKAGYFFFGTLFRIVRPLGLAPLASRKTGAAGFDYSMKFAAGFLFNYDSGYNIRFPDELSWGYLITLSIVIDITEAVSIILSRGLFLWEHELSDFE